MSGIYFLNHTDFEVMKGDRGDMMTLKYDKKGLTLVLFYSKELPSCDFMMTRFKQLPGLMNGCNFAMVNMNKNMELVEVSRNTIAPISYVPDLTLFVNGCPFIRYDGPQEIDNICNFLRDIYDKIHKLQFSSKNQNGGGATNNQVAVSLPPVPVPMPVSMQSPQQGISSVRAEDVEFTRGSSDTLSQMNNTSDLFQKQNYHIRPPSTSDKMSSEKNQFYNERVQPALPQGLQNIQSQDMLQSTSVDPVPAYTVGVPKMGGGGNGKKNYMSFQHAYTT